MRVLFVSFMGGSPWGGSEELWYQTALHLRRLGHEISASVYYFHNPAPAIAILERHGVAVQQRRRGRPALGRRIQSRLRGMTAPDAELSELASWIRTRRPDFICASNGVGIDMLDGLELIAASGIPWCNISQCGMEWIWPTDSQATRASVFFRTNAHWFFVAERNRQLFQTQWGVHLEHAEIVRNPFNVAFNNNLPAPQDDGTVRLACVARHDPACKGQDLLLKVLAQEKWRHRAMRLSLFGKGDHTLSIRRLIDRLNLADCAALQGHVDSIEDIWRDHHALILPSCCEGFPLALVEAALCRRLAIVTDVGGNAEMTLDGVTGFVAPAPTITQLDEALERAWLRRLEWQSMGLAARERAINLIPTDPAGAFAQRLLDLSAPG